MNYKHILFTLLLLPLSGLAADLDVLSEAELEAAFEAATQKFTQQPAPMAQPVQEEAQAAAPVERAPAVAAPVEKVSASPVLAQPQNVAIAPTPAPVGEIDLRPYSVGITMVQDDPMRLEPAYSRGQPEVDLAALRIAINMEETTLQNAIESIVRRASDKVGQWDVRWRLQPENSYLLNEKMSVTAETTLGQFMEYMTDRVNNMTGVELFVSVFDVSRLIVISDTYY